MARAVGGETRLDRVLELIAKRSRALVGARSMLILLVDGDEVMRVAGLRVRRGTLGIESKRPAPENAVPAVGSE